MLPDATEGDGGVVLTSRGDCKGQDEGLVIDPLSANVSLSKEGDGGEVVGEAVGSIK